VIVQAIDSTEEVLTAWFTAQKMRGGGEQGPDSQAQKILCRGSLLWGGGFTTVCAHELPRHNILWGVLWITCEQPRGIPGQGIEESNG
jgi:hypothetical protein